MALENILRFLLTLNAIDIVKGSNPESIDVGFVPPPTKKDCRQK